MSYADDFWLSATATQRNMRHVWSYGAVFYGTAALQAWKLGMDVPMAFWQSMARMGTTAPVPPTPAPKASKAKPASKPKLVETARVVATPAPTAPKPAAKAKPKAAQAKSASKAKPEAKVTPAVDAKVKALTKSSSKPKAVSKVSKTKSAETSVKPIAEAKVPKAKKAKAKKPTEQAKAKTVKATADPVRNPHLLDEPRGGKADDLTQLSGVGERLGQTLNDFGIYHFDQIATLDETGIAWLNEQQPGFKALAKRFDLVAQAKATAG